MISNTFQSMGNGRFYGNILGLEVLRRVGGCQRGDKHSGTYPKSRVHNGLGNVAHAAKPPERHTYCLGSALLVSRASNRHIFGLRGCYPAVKGSQNSHTYSGLPHRHSDPSTHPRLTTNDLGTSFQHPEYSELTYLAFGGANLVPGHPAARNNPRASTRCLLRSNGSTYEASHEHKLAPAVHNDLGVAHTCTQAHLIAFSLNITASVYLTIPGHKRLPEAQRPRGYATTATLGHKLPRAIYNDAGVDHTCIQAHMIAFSLNIMASKYR